MSVAMSADLVIPAGNNILPFDVTNFDDVGGWDGDTYIVDRPGCYLLGAQVRRDALGTGSNGLLQITKNGVLLVSNSSLSSTAAVWASLTYLAELDAGDQLEVVFRGSTTLSSTITGAASWFWLTRVGPVAWT